MNTATTPLYVVSFSTSEGSRVFAFRDRAAAEERYQSDYWGNKADGLATLLPGRDDDAIAHALPFLAGPEHCAQCGEEWPCSDSQRRDIRPDLRVLHTVKPLPGKPYGGPGPKLYDFYVVRVNGDALDTHAAETLEEALALAMPDDGDRIDYGTVQAKDAGAARLMRPEMWLRARSAIESQQELEDADFLLRYHNAQYDRCFPWARRLFQAKGLALAVLAAFLSLPAFAAPPCKVNVNTATPEQLQLLARTGPVLAGRLASGRPYRHLEAVEAVKGVGPTWLSVNGPHVAFTGPTTCTEKVAAPKPPKVAAQAPKL